MKEYSKAEAKSLKCATDIQHTSHWGLQTVREETVKRSKNHVKAVQGKRKPVLGPKYIYTERKQWQEE